MGLDYNAIRERIIELKKQARMTNYDFCKIYAPEKCDTKSNAENYISALSTGRNYPSEKHGPLLPDLEHLQNIVDSGAFQDVTLNYLVYGEKTPTKTVKIVDLDLSTLTHLDFCKLIWALKTKYPNKITIYNDMETFEQNPEYDASCYERERDTISISIDVSVSTSNSDYDYFSLGQAISYFYYELKDADNLRDEEVRKFAYLRLLKKIDDYDRSNNPFYKKLDDCDSDSVFLFF